MKPIEIPDIDPHEYIDDSIRSVYNEKLGFNVRYGPLTVVEMIEAEEHGNDDMQVFWMCWKMYNKAYPTLTFEEFGKIKRDVLTEITKTILGSVDFRGTPSEETSPSSPDTNTSE